MLKELEGQVVASRIRTRPPEVILFDNQIRALMLESPDTKVKDLAKQMEVPKSRVINSIHRLQQAGELPRKKHEFVQEKGKNVERRNQIKEYVENYVKGLDGDTFITAVELVGHLKDDGILTSDDFVRETLKKMNINTTEINKKVREKLRTESELPKQIINRSQSYDRDEDNMSEDDEKLSDAMSADRIDQVRVGLIRDLLLNNTPNSEIKYLTHVDNSQLDDAVIRLKENGELPSQIHIK